MVVRRNPDDRRDADRQRGHRNLHGGVDVHGVVFHVDEQPVVAAFLGDAGDVDARRLGDPQRIASAAERSAHDGGQGHGHGDKGVEQGGDAGVGLGQQLGGRGAAEGFGQRQQQAAIWSCSWPIAPAWRLRYWGP